LKNTASRRSVPLHPQLLAMGFACYVEARRGDVHSKALFPELAPNRPDDSYGVKMSRWFASFLAKLPGPPILATFHSFRNCFTVAAQKAGVPEDRINRICGWSSGSRQQRDYARDRFLAEHAEEIAKVQYAGLQLPAFTETK
jgi:integrase